MLIVVPILASIAVILCSLYRYKQKNTPFLVMILKSKTSFALPFISTIPSWSLLSFQLSLMAFPILNKLKFDFGLYCTSLYAAFNCSLPNLLHQVPAISIMLLVHLWFLCHYLHLYCYLCIYHLYNVQTIPSH